ESALWLLILAIVLTVIVPYITQRALSIPLDNAINAAERIAAGERNVTIEIMSSDKLGKLLLSLNSMQDAIKKNEEMLRNKEEETRVLLETLINSSKKFSLHSSKVASGDLRHRLEIENEGILQDLGRDLNSMTDRLSSMTKKITQASSDIVTMVGTVLTSANKQAKEISSQASAINQISASLEEIDNSSKKTMAKAQVLREVAQNTYEQGKRGAHSVEQSILGIRASEEKMKLIAQTILDLSNHMKQIGEITVVVNTLAQQSKMLALNASIEASKAGESGKGFAAVATEVRNLAEQSEQSTVQVQKILEDIRRSTEKAVIVTEEGANTLDSGIKLIEKAGDVIHALSKMINEASISSQHIEVSIRQEAVGIEQIVESMNEINRVTATFSTGIEEMMTFIHHLDDIVKHLKEDISLYKV
ncbi:TPA: methyl-accepting chemotaxis protein, partial [Legionella bozemanae]